MGPGNHVLNGGPDSKGANSGTRRAHCKYRNFLPLCMNGMAELINLPFGLWTWVGRRKHKFNLICQVAPMCPHGKEHWRHLANTIELSSAAAMRSYVKLR